MQACVVIGTIFALKLGKVVNKVQVSVNDSGLQKL